MLEFVDSNFYTIIICMFVCFVFFNEGGNQCECYCKQKQNK